MEKVLKNSNSKNIIIVDSSYSFETLKKIMENDESVIVSFDYDSHKILSDNGIKHQISDDFLSMADLWYIWRKSRYRFRDGLCYTCFLSKGRRISQKQTVYHLGNRQGN